MEKMCVAESEGKATQRLSYLGIHPIMSPNPNIIVEVKKCISKEACYVCLLEGPCQSLIDTEVDTSSQPLD